MNPNFIIVITCALITGIFSGCYESNTSDMDSGMNVSDSSQAEDSGTSTWQMCNLSSDCTVISESCCGSCGQATSDDLIAIHRDSVSDYRSVTCGEEGVDCPACYMEPDPYLVATCESNRCVAHDLRFDESLADCTSDSDCIVRSTTCCPSCSPLESDEFIAINRSRERQLERRLCLDDELGCPDCPSYMPPNLNATCVSEDRGTGGAPARRYCRVTSSEASGG